MVVFVLTAIVLMARVLAAIAKKSNAAMLVLACVVTAVHAQSSLAPLTQSEIKQSLFGQRVTGEYASGLAWAERFNTDFTSDYVQNGVPSRGLMRFEGDVLCFRYGEKQLTGGCFEIWRRGTNCFDFYSVSAAGPNASLTQRRHGEGWDARAWIDGQPGTCSSDQIS